MAKELTDILKAAAEVRDETALQQNTATRVGGVLTDLAQFLGEAVFAAGMTAQTTAAGVSLLIKYYGADGQPYTKELPLPVVSLLHAGVLTPAQLADLNTADRNETTARQASDAELLRRIQGISTSSSAYSDPCINLGGFDNLYAEDGTTIIKHATIVAQESLEAQLQGTMQEVMKYIGKMRGLIYGIPFEAWNFVHRWPNAQQSSIYVQVLHSNFPANAAGELARQDSHLHTLCRTVNVYLDADGNFDHSEVSPWRECSLQEADRNNLAAFAYLGAFDSMDAATAKAATIPYASNADFVLLRFRIGDKGGLILQNVNGASTEQYLFYNGKRYLRYVDFTSADRTAVKTVQAWKLDGVAYISYNATNRIIYQRNQWDENISGGGPSTLPLASASYAGLLSNTAFTHLSNFNIYEHSTPTTNSVRLVFTKPLTGEAGVVTLAAATSARAGVMSASDKTALDAMTSLLHAGVVTPAQLADLNTADRNETTARQASDAELLRRIQGISTESSAFTDPLISDGELIRDRSLSADDKNAIFNVWLNCYCSNSDIDLSPDEVWSDFVAADVVRLTGTHRASVDGKLVVVEQGMAATLSNHTQVITGQFKPSADGSMLLTNYSRVDTLSRVITISTNDDGSRSVTFSKWRSLQKDKAPVIVNNVLFDGNKTLLDSAADDVRGCVLYGRSVQNINPSYNLYSPSDTTQWLKYNAKLDYEFVGNTGTGIKVTILSLTGGGTPQLSAHRSPLASKFAPINKGEIFVSLGKLTKSKNVSTVDVSVTFYKKDVETGKDVPTKSERITATADGVKMSINIKGIEFYTIRIHYRFAKSDSGSFAAGDWFALESLRIATSEEDKPYKVNKCLEGSQIQIGSTSFPLPVTLRGVPNEDKWNFKYNGQKYLCDTLNLITGKVTKWVKSDIDAQTSEAITDYSSYILSRKQVSDCSVPKSISTAYPHTDIVQTPLDVSCGVSIDYTADTKSYVDIGASKDYVTPEDYGAVGDGINDDTEAIVSWLKSLTPYKVLGRKKVYKMRPIGVEITDGVTIDGNSSTLITDVSPVSPTEKSYLLILRGSGTLRINNCSFDINARSLIDTGYTSLSGSCLGGISLLQFDKVYMDGCYITDTMGGSAISCETDIECCKCRFVKLGHVEEPLLAYPNYSFGAIGSIGNVVAKDCYFDRVGAACVTTEKSIIMSGCNVVNSYNSTIECPLGGHDNVHVVVDNCVFDKCMGPIFNGASQGTIRQCEQLSVSITNNVVKDYMGGSRPKTIGPNNSNMFLSYLSENNGGSWHNASIHITGNTLSVSDHINSDEVTNTRIGIGQLIGAGDVVVQNNVIHATGNGAIISALRCIKFAGNACKNVEDIRIMKAKSVDVSDNQFCDNANKCPIIEPKSAEVERFSIQNNTTASSSYLLHITKGCSQIILTGNVCQNLMQIVGNLTLKGIVTGNMANINLFNDASLTSQLLVTGNLPS